MGTVRDIVRDGGAVEGARGSGAPVELVHKSSERDAFPTGWRRTGDTTFVVTAQLPHDHPFFTPVATAHGDRDDPLLIVEIMRQITLLITHAGFEVPIGHHFLLNSMDFAFLPERLRSPAAGTRSTELTADVRCSEIGRRAGHLARMRSDVELRLPSGRVAATGVGRIGVLSPAVYRRLRGVLPTEAGGPVPVGVPKELVGRTDDRDVVLASLPGADTWELRVDTAHPTFFQHPNDHVPGMLLLEAARQAASALTGPGSFVPAGGGIIFDRYADLGIPCVVRARETAPDTVEVTAHQNDTRIFHCALSTLSTLTAPRRPQ